MTLVEGPDRNLTQSVLNKVHRLDYGKQYPDDRSRSFLVKFDAMNDEDEIGRLLFGSMLFLPLKTRNDGTPVIMKMLLSPQGFNIMEENSDLRPPRDSWDGAFACVWKLKNTVKLVDTRRGARANDFVRAMVAEKVFENGNRSPNGAFIIVDVLFGFWISVKTSLYDKLANIHKSMRTKSMHRREGKSKEYDMRIWKRRFRASSTFFRNFARELVWQDVMETKKGVVYYDPEISTPVLGANKETTHGLEGDAKYQHIVVPPRGEKHLPTTSRESSLDDDAIMIEEEEHRDIPKKKKHTKKHPLSLLPPTSFRTGTEDSVVFSPIWEKFNSSTRGRKDRFAQITNAANEEEAAYDTSKEEGEEEEEMSLSGESYSDDE